MRRSNLFWGSFILIMGVLFLLNTLGIIPRSVNIWNIVWPLGLILVGLWFLFSGVIFRGRLKDVEEVSIPLEGAGEAVLKIRHGAGQLFLGSSPDTMNLLTGSFTGGVEQMVMHENDRLKVKLKAPSISGVNFVGLDTFGLRWDMRVNKNVALRLDVDSGASSSELDLTDLKVKEIKLDSGASSTSIRMPANAGMTDAFLETGAASLDVTIPQGVAARISVKTDLASANVDTTRFPMVESGLYVSADYETAANRINLQIKTDLGSVNIH